MKTCATCGWDGGVSCNCPELCGPKEGGLSDHRAWKPKTMPKLETSEDEEILQFLNNLADYCIPMSGGKMRMTSQVWPIVKARDAAIRKECANKAVGHVWPDGPEYPLEPEELRAAIMGDKEEGE